MMMQDFINALQKLPTEYQQVQFDSVKFTLFRGVIFLIHSWHPPMVYQNDQWEPFILNPQRENHD